jgi:hypothetical protein
MDIKTKTRLVNEVNDLIKKGYKFKAAYYAVKKRYSDMPPINEIAGILGKRPKKKKPESALEKLKRMREEREKDVPSPKMIQSTLWNEENSMSVNKQKQPQKQPQKQTQSDNKTFTISQDTEINLNGSKYLLEKGDKITIQ